MCTRLVFVFAYLGYIQASHRTASLMKVDECNLTNHHIHFLNYTFAFMAVAVLIFLVIVSV